MVRSAFASTSWILDFKPKSIGYLGRRTASMDSKPSFWSQNALPTLSLALGDDLKCTGVSMSLEIRPPAVAGSFRVLTS
jgi:hypothetical protein